jgi:hypothetical protein
MVTDILEDPVVSVFMAEKQPEGGNSAPPPQKKKKL